MAIVPLTKDVSMRTIRDVINQKALMLGQARAKGTTYGLYGQDHITGYVQTHLKNTSSSTINITVQLTQNGVIGGRTQTFNLDPNSTKLVTFSSLPGKTGSFSKGNKTNYKPANSYNGNYDYDLTITKNTLPESTIEFNNIDISTPSKDTYHTLVIPSEFPTEKISIARDSGDITANYQLKNGVQIPKTLPDDPAPNNAKLSDWRGAQVIQGNTLTRTSSKGRYGVEQGVGLVHIYLDPIGFSNGPVTVTLPKIKSITKNISNTSDRIYRFNDLAGGKTYIFYIKDEITGNETSLSYYIKTNNYNTSLTYESYSFNGTDEFLAFIF